ncbi:MAG: DinB family protein [Bacteroidia bacterium]|nr:DinB family protein [Bacteroidia bacterium]
MKNPYLKDIIERMDLVGKKVAGTLGFLTTQQLNWRENPQSWSIAQYVHYIIAINKSYLPTLIQVNNGTRKAKKREKLPILPDLWGTMLVRMLKSDPKGPPKATNGLTPPSSPIGNEILEEFAEHQGSMIHLLQELDREDHDSIIITSPENSFVTYPIKDIIKGLCLQEERHLKLALEVLGNSNFPKE